MALTDEDEVKLKAELEANKKQLTELLAKQKADANDTSDGEEKKRKKEKAGGPATDPDTVKEIADLKQRIAVLEGEKKNIASGGSLRLNFFKE